MPDQGAIAATTLLTSPPTILEDLPQFAASTPAPQGHVPVPPSLDVPPEPARILLARFFSSLAAGATGHCCHGHLSGVEADDGPPSHLVTAKTTNGMNVTEVVALPAAQVLVQRGGGRVHLYVLAVSESLAEAGLEQARSWFTVTSDEDPDRVPVDFWQAGRGMTRRTRPIEVPRWSDIAHNYPDDVHAGLADAMDLDFDTISGRIMLWHGPPGTGKTTAIRALARSWRDTARMQVVLDPESVFANAANLMEVLLADGDSDVWRLLVVEDADEIVRAGSDRTVRSLSRLLNVGDGIVGQGLKVLVLLTTNEPPERLHPALGRPGRCLSSIGFRRFTRPEARAAFADRAIPDGDELTLAEILHGCDGTTSASTGTYL